MLYLFNPENDLALANFTSNYTPPASAVRMARELAVLPIWFAAQDKEPYVIVKEDTNEKPHVGDVSNADVKPIVVAEAEANREPMVIAEGSVNRDFLNRMKEVLPLQATLISYSDIASFPDRRIVPWGWNPSLARRLSDHGASKHQLPSTEALERLRGYSNRRHSVEMLKELRGHDAQFIGDARYFTGMEELSAYLNSFPGDKALKMPLSGSGKGLIWILDQITDKQADWARKVIREQGGIVAEPKYNRVKDFAMEFYLDTGAVRFTGYSLFRTAASGAYMGNELLNDQRIVEVLSCYTDSDSSHRLSADSSYCPSPDLLQQLKEWFVKELSNRFPHYKGYAGVDMMICDTGGGYKVHPCVEINTRMNMGVASRLFHERFVQPGREGRFMVDYIKKPEGALSFHHAMERDHPLEVKDKMVASGYLPLTPVTANTRYIAYAIVR